MIRRLALLAAAATLLAGCSHGEDGDTARPTGYATLVDSPIRGLSAEEIEQLRTGAGMQLALPAELNGYPGPKHVLELATQLELNASQSAAVQRLYDETNQRARAEGGLVLEAYEAIDAWFRSGAGAPAELARLMGQLGEREAALRQVHLEAHLACKEILTMHQLELYKELRGYGAGDHSAHH